MKIATRRRVTRLYNNAGSLIFAAGLALLAFASLIARGRL